MSTLWSSSQAIGFQYAAATYDCPLTSTVTQMNTNDYLFCDVVFRGFDVDNDNYEVKRQNSYLISSTAASKVDFTFLYGGDPSVIVFAYSADPDEASGTFVRVAYETGSGTYELGDEFSALSFEPPQLAIGIIGRKDELEESQVLLAYSWPFY